MVQLFLRRVLPGLLIVAVFSIAIFARTRADAKYTISFRGPTGPSVAAIFKGRAVADSVVLSALLQDEAISISNLTALTEENDSTQFAPESRAVKYDATDVHFTVYRYPRPRSTQNLQVTYDAALGKREGDDHALGYTGRRHGYITPTWAVFSLANLLLLPSDYASVVTRYTLPHGWHRAPDYKLPRSQRTAEFENELYFAPQVCGKFLSHRNGNLEVLVVGTESETTANSIFAQIDAAFERMTEATGMQLRGPFRIVVTPPLEDGYQVFLQPTHFGCVVTSLGDRIIGAISLMLNLGQRLRFDSEIDELINADNDRWFRDGYVAYRATIDARSYFEDMSARDSPTIAEQYAALVDNGDFSLATHPVALGPRHQTGGILKSIAAAERLDSLIASKTSSQRTLDGFIRATVSKHEEVKDLHASLESYSGVSLKQFFDEFVYGSKPLPYPALGETKTLHPQITATDSIQILATYDGRGYLENCGCKVNQSGGVARLVSLVRSLRQTFHGPTFAISLGNAFPYDDQTLALDAVQQRETALYIGLLSDVGYDCAVIGESELLYGPQVFRNISATERVSFVSANLRSPQLDDLVAPSKNLESQGAKVLLVGVTAFPFEKIERVWRLRNPNSRFVDIKDAVTNSLRQRDSKELAIAAGAIRPSVGRRLLDMPDGPDVTISYDDNCLCSKQDSTSYHDISGFYKGRLALYAQLGTYGISKFVLYRDATGKIISFSERQIFLDDSVQSDISVRAAIDSFYMTAIKNIPTERNRSLNLWPEEVSAGATYVGAATCRPCHDEQYSQWQRTKHSAAIKTLLHAHRQYNSNCVVCHVTGGGQPSGFRYGDISSDLVNVQCEVCHGPGSRHAASAGTATLVAKPSEALCIQCHDQSHSTMDRQNFQSFYARVAH